MNVGVHVLGSDAMKGVVLKYWAQQVIGGFYY